MKQPDEHKEYDVLIVGAGPAGCACALTLKNAGLKTAIIDKAAFPRDKVCGDAIPGRAIKTLRSIDPEFETAFRQLPTQFETKNTTLYYKNRRLTFDWVQPAYTCARMDFDHFLVQLVQQHTATTLQTGTPVEQVTAIADGMLVQLKGSATQIKTKLLIGADGAHSIVARQLAHRALNRAHHVGSVRAYYTNVACDSSGTTEIYFDKQFLPSYLWVFPLPGNRANVGFGMLSSEIAARKINLKKAFYEFIARVPLLQQKFSNATQSGQLEGFGLPLGSDIGALSDNNFMLTGDAASLIDPISGDGIGNAMLSGRLAAAQAIQCFRANDFSAACMKGYDNALIAAIGSELQSRYKAQRLLSRMPMLLDLIFFAGSNKTIRNIIQKRL